MIIRKPITSTKDKNNRYKTHLHFEGGGKAEFYIRGAIGWPEGQREGFVIMAGQQIESGQIVVFEQAWFWTINYWNNPDGTLKKISEFTLEQRRKNGIKNKDIDKFHFGLIHHIKEWESKYKCASYFHGGQHVDIVRRHSLELYKLETLPHNIEIIEVPYVTEVGDDLIVEYTQVKNRCVGDHGSPLHDSLKKWEGIRHTGSGDNNAVHALRALLAGYEAQPYVKMEMGLI